MGQRAGAPWGADGRAGRGDKQFNGSPERATHRPTWNAPDYCHACDFCGTEMGRGDFFAHRKRCTFARATRMSTAKASAFLRQYWIVNSCCIESRAFAKDPDAKRGPYEVAIDQIS